MTNHILPPVGEGHSKLGLTISENGRHAGLGGGIASEEGEAGAEGGTSPDAGGGGSGWDGEQSREGPGSPG